MEDILIIDDEPAICKLISEILMVAGFEVRCATSVAEGIQAAYAQAPDLILCDVILSDGTGYELLDAMQRHPGLVGVPFIFVSGGAKSQEDVRRGMISGADDYLAKPFKPRELLEAVEARLRRVRRLNQTIPETDSCFAGSSDQLQKLLTRRDQPYALFAVGLHRFERLLRLFGWQEAEQLVAHVIKRLKTSLGTVSLKAYRGREAHLFYLLLEDAQDPDGLEPLARRLLSSVAAPLRFKEHELHLAANVGLIQGPSATDALRLAELALLRAELRGANGIEVGSAALADALRLDLHWEEELHKALKDGRFELYYQPQFDLKSLNLIGVEALLRLRHPEHGMISPGLFIPVAESCGLMLSIGQWVLETACLQLAEWQARDGVRLKLAVNVSYLQFQQSDFTARVSDGLLQAGLGGDCGLVLELTESVVMHDAQDVVRQLGALKALGLTLAMDDFGTGYSSLATLSRLPFDTLKIDQAFVRGLDSDAIGAIPRAIIEMGHHLGLNILAEGIETEAQLERLRQMGCDQGQGFWYGRPEPAEQVSQRWRQR